MTQTKEYFRPVKGYEGYYKISNLGTVKSIARTVIRRDGFERRVTEKIIPPSISANGMSTIVLSKDGKYELRSLRQLLLETYNPDYNIRTDRIVLKDGDRSNFSISNLKNEMLITRAGGRVIVDRGTDAKKKAYLTLQRAGTKLGFNAKTLLNQIAEDRYESHRNIKLKFEVPFTYRGKTISKIDL